MTYQLTWITNQLAAGCAPMSYDDLEIIKKEGVDAIVNLCGEFSDLHEIEENAGFEVYFLPVPDECAPDMEEIEKALAWLDEAIYLKKKVLIHCRHGHGRTGTFISAYMLRRGFSLKNTERLLKKNRANPTNYSQWKLLKKYHKQVGVLSAVEPSMKVAPGSHEIAPFIQEYKAVLQEIDNELAARGETASNETGSQLCCQEYFETSLIESIYVNNSMNRKLTREDRQSTIKRAGECSLIIKTCKNIGRNLSELHDKTLSEIYAATGTYCPFFIADRCQRFASRPSYCRWSGSSLEDKEKEKFSNMLKNISKDIYLAMTGSFPPESELRFSMADTVSGRFIQIYFEEMLKK